jgi:hypothetical protein
MTIKVIQLVGIFLTSLFTIVNIGRLICKQKVPVSNIILQALGITMTLSGFILN